MTSPAILELEHDGNEYVPAVYELGDDPEHCDECRRVHQRRLLQAGCDHTGYGAVMNDTFSASGELIRRDCYCSGCGGVGEIHRQLLEITSREAS